MMLDDIEDWDDIEIYLETNFDNPHQKYMELVNYQNEMARTKYKLESPMTQWNYSFRDTINHIKEL